MSKQLGLEVHLWDSWKPAFSRIDSVTSRISALFIIYPQIYEALEGPNINVYSRIVCARICLSLGSSKIVVFTHEIP